MLNIQLELDCKVKGDFIVSAQWNLMQMQARVFRFCLLKLMKIIFLLFHSYLLLVLVKYVNIPMQYTEVYGFNMMECKNEKKKVEHFCKALHKYARIFLAF